MDERAALVRELLTAMPRHMLVEFGYLTSRGDATSFVREHVRAAAARIGIDVGDTDNCRAPEQEG